MSTTQLPWRPSETLAHGVQPGKLNVCRLINMSHRFAESVRPVGAASTLMPVLSLVSRAEDGALDQGAISRLDQVSHVLHLQ